MHRSLSVPVRLSVSLALLGCLSLFSSGCGETAADEPVIPAAADGTALARCSEVDFAIPPPARPAAGAAEGEASLVPKGTGTVRFHGRASGKASWVASVPKNLAYAYFAEDAGGRVSFDVQVGEEPGGKSRDVTVRVDHVWRPGAAGELCSAPTASVSIHENIDDEQASAIAGSVVVKAFDPDGRHLGVSFEAETTAYKIFVDLDFTGKPR